MGGNSGHTDVVSDNNDRNQFSDQINQANETLEKKCSIACADTGYDNTDELKKIDDQEIKVIVPLQQEANKDKRQGFNKKDFTYDQQKDCYVCPEGNILTYRSVDTVKKSKIYKITDSSLCRSFNHFNVCTKSTHGKKMRRLLNPTSTNKK